MSGPLAIALLAAGEARRFGGGKLDADLRGKRLGRHSLDAALALDQGPVLVVIGDPAPAFAREAGDVELLVNRNAAEGLGTSVALAWAPCPAATRQADGHPGIPACFPRDWFEALARLGGDKGAGALLRASDRVRLVAVPEAELADVDRPGDLIPLSNSG